MKNLITTILIAIIITAVPAYAFDEWSIKDGVRTDTIRQNHKKLGNEDKQESSLADQAYRRALEAGARDCYSYGCDGCESCY